MSAFKRISLGWSLGCSSLRIVFHDKTLLLFPMIPITAALAVILSFLAIIGADQLFWALFVIQSVKHVRYLAIGYAIVAIISVYFAMGLVACTRITLEERDSKLADGMLASAKKFHWVVIWALISWSIGPILNLLDHLRFTSQWVRRILKTNWSQLSFFLLPILVVDNVNVFSAIKRSIERSSSTWGRGSVSQLGLLWFFAALNLPTLALFAYGHILEGPWPRWMTIVVLAMVYFTVVIYQTATAVLSVVLYKYALDRSVVSGFREEWLKDAFVKPKVHVLAGSAEESLDDMPPPDGVEPADGEPKAAPNPEDASAAEASGAPEDTAPEDTAAPDDSPSAQPETDHESGAETTDAAHHDQPDPGPRSQ
ncbi:MAG: hypothetical protein KF886_09935 [Candidatus Hydrogenedentes bacterium]|nr:hypothetical protein [Candidatus Hydrogenedentota bacterium]